MIYVMPMDRSGCGEYRLAMAARVLAAQGHDVNLAPDGRVGMRSVIFNNRTVRVDLPDDAEVVVVQRPAFFRQVEAIEQMVRQGIAVVVDVDDDMTRIHPGNVCFDAMHPRRRDLNWRHVERACDTATLVTVSTPTLAKIYARHGRFAVIPNCVPERYLSIGREDSTTVGWAGTVWTHPDDLQTVGNALARLRPHFVHVGDPERVARNLGLNEIDSVGIVTFEDYPVAVAKFGVGIAPLADSAFNRSKSWLKVLEMAALGVPWVGSDRIEYRRLHALGCGIVVDRPKDWERSLRRLLASPEARSELSEAGREVARHLTVEANAWRWLEAWRDAAARRGASDQPKATFDLVN